MDLAAVKADRERAFRAMAARRSAITALLMHVSGGLLGLFVHKAPAGPGPDFWSGVDDVRKRQQEIWDKFGIKETFDPTREFFEK